MDLCKQEEKVKAKMVTIEVKKSNEKYILSIAGMQLKFESLDEVKDYANEVRRLCNERLFGEIVIHDTPTGKLSLVHRASKQALLLKDESACIKYANMIDAALERQTV